MIERVFYVYLNDIEIDNDYYIKIYDGEDGLACGDKNSVALKVFTNEFYMRKNEWEELKQAVDEYFKSKEN